MVILILINSRRVGVKLIGFFIGYLLRHPDGDWLFNACDVSSELSTNKS